jgi:hypothetical protein
MMTFLRIRVPLLVLVWSSLVLPAYADKYALVIGISGYPNYAPERRLDFTDDDARSFAEFLTSPEGGAFPGTNVVSLLNSEATRSAIFRQLSAVAQRARADDTVYVFFAGHGQEDVNGRVYLMPFEADPSQPDALGWRADHFLQDIRERFTARHIVVFLDACYAGAAVAPGGAARGDVNISAAIAQQWRQAFQGVAADGMNMVFLSAGSNQRSWEDRDLKHGVFTHYLLEGLHGAADRDRDGVVTVAELRDYVTTAVEQHTARRSFGRQSPSIVGAVLPDFPLAVVGPRSSAAPPPRSPTVPGVIATAPSGRFRTLPLSQLTNHPLDWLIQPPSGLIQLSGVPFQVEKGQRAVFITRGHFLRDKPERGSFRVDSSGVAALHLLLSGAWVVNVGAGELIGELVLNFSDGRQLRFPLRSGENIREGWEYESALTPVRERVVAGVRWRNAWEENQVRGDNPVRDRARAFLDLVTVSIPSEMRQVTLTSVDVIDSGIVRQNRTGDGQIDPSVVLAGATVEFR